MAHSAGGDRQEEVVDEMARMMMTELRVDDKGDETITPKYLASKLKLNLAIHSYMDILTYESYFYGSDEADIVHLVENYDASFSILTSRPFEV